EHDRPAVSLSELLRATHRDHRVQHVQRVEALLEQIAAAGFFHHVRRSDFAPLEPTGDDVEAPPIDGVGVVAALRTPGRNHEHRVAALEHVIAPLVALGLAGVFQAAELRFDVRHSPFYRPDGVPSAEGLGIVPRALCTMPLLSLCTMPLLSLCTMPRPSALC